MRHKYIVIVGVVLAIVVMLLLLLDFGMFNQPQVVTLVGYSKYSPSWIDIKNGALSAGRKAGLHITAVASDSRQDAVDQVRLIDNAIEQKTDALIIMPTSMVALQDALERAQRSGIEVIVLNGHHGEMAFDRVGTSVDAMVESLMDTLHLPDDDSKLRIACLYTFDDDGKSYAALQRVYDYVDAHPTIEIVTDRVSAADANAAFSITSTIVRDHAVDYIIALDEALTAGAAQALQARHTQLLEPRHVQLVGWGHVDECAVYLADRTIQTLIVQNFYGIGYMAVDRFIGGGRRDVAIRYVVVHADDLQDKTLQQILFNLN